MTYTNKEITSIFEGLALVRRSEITFPAKIGYAIVRNIRILEPIYQDIIDSRNRIILDNSKEKQAEQDFYTVAEDKKDFVNKELKSLGEAENDISLTKIKMKDIESLDLPIDIVEGLFYMIEDEG